MSVLVWLAIPALVGIAAISILAYRGGKLRRPGSIEDDMRQFRRGLDALDPANDPMRRREQESSRKRPPSSPSDR